MELDELTAIRGAPENIRSDNGSEFIADVMKEWCRESGTNTLYIEPGALAARNRSKFQLQD